MALPAEIPYALADAFGSEAGAEQAEVDDSEGACVAVPGSDSSGDPSKGKERRMEVRS